MATQAAQGVLNPAIPPAGDIASAVLTGRFAAVGTSQPVALFGQNNLAVYASFASALTTTQGSLSASVVSGGGLAPGAAVNSANVPAGTTWATFAGTSGTLALPAITLQGVLGANGVIFGLASTAGLVGAAVTGPGVPAGATVASVLTPALSATSASNAAPTLGAVQLSTAATTQQTMIAAQAFTFALGPQAITTGTDANATFTGAAITFSATIQLERSFDGGQTWVVCNIGSSGTLAQWQAGTPVSLSWVEPERGVDYRLNCAAYTSGTINYRLSQTAGAPMSLHTGGTV